MPSSTKMRLVLGFLSNCVSKVAATIIQLVQVPVFLHFWSVSLYGEWMIVNSIPAYLSFSNIGFGSVAGNEMTMMVARDDREGALRVFQSCWWLIASICAGILTLLSIGLYYLPITQKLRLSAISVSDTKWVIVLLGISVLLGQLEQLLQSAYRCVGRYPYGSLVKSFVSLAAFSCMIIPVIMGGGPRVTALAFATANLIGTALMCILARRDIPWLRYGWNHASIAEIRRLTGPAVAFMGFPIGNALNLQGTLIVIGYALGPAAVVIFGTARTVSRVALQMVQMVNTTFWPEMSMAFGQRNDALIRALHRRACQMALIIAVAVVAGAMTIGPWFLSHWTGGHVPPSRGLLSLLLLVVIFYSLWSTSSTLLTAINQHQRLATYYIFATGITCVFCYLLAWRYGLYGAAVSLLLSEVVMNLYVLPASLKIAQDTFPAFFASMWSYPQSLRLTILLARLKTLLPKLDLALRRFHRRKKQPSCPALEL